MADIRRDFERTADGPAALAARTALVDELVGRLWSAEMAAEPKLANGVAFGAVGGYGRRQLFPSSDVDLLFLVEKNDLAKEAIRHVSQALWDCGLKIALSSRPTSDCEKFEATNPEFGLSLMDFRPLGGDSKLLSRMQERCLPRLFKHDKSILAELGSLTRERHKKYGNTLFHLEPNIKDCPGGLRDGHVAIWLHRILSAKGRDVPMMQAEEFREAEEFLTSVRVFLHYRHERDDNTLEWRSQDAAAELGIGLSRGPDRRSADGSYWMRVYFRHARVVERAHAREAELTGMRLSADETVKSLKIPSGTGFRIRDRRIELEDRMASGSDPAHEPEVVLAVFAAMAATGTKLSPESEERIGDGIPLLSAHLEEGPGLWRSLSKILTGEFAANALRTMHAIGMLELILPEFHGIDALVIRDAYHRYTVDEHTFVLIETLHGLEQPAPQGAPDWRVKFGAMIRELQNPGLLYLAALLHDTGKGRASDDHAAESARMATSVIERLEMDSYDAGLVLGLIENHLEMSAALRRDIFDAETVRAFASKVQTPEALRMLTLFTYADINAVHPDALTPWKAENLWRLSMSTANQLDRSVDEERVRTGEVRVKGVRRRDTRVARFMELARGEEEIATTFLEGFPERYLETRAPETIFRHFEMTRHFAEEPFQIAFRHGMNMCEITLVTQDRPRLFAGMAGALAAWGMNVVTADAFANAAGVVVDSFRFTDTFRTLELNESERERFVTSVREMVAGRADVESMLRSRRRAKRRAPRVLVETRIEFDDSASSHATLLQIVTQDVPGLLRAVSTVISAAGLNVEVALIDTEGEVAIDVFYLSSNAERLSPDQKKQLRDALQEAIELNAN
ncbi:HD domain-containing protein [Granulicella cerasi]|uniref:Bifunctional uridylyltransferase/uridylyl-removing enzyme n=1 Tax=Granulicella cerasi TaxID=741063 RepID=A0ABW1Z875_9BACT|nr:HD domain-containing protein [Granulicella cerasi]